MAGQQNYLDLTLETYEEASCQYLKNSCEKYFLKKRFGIGENIDKDKVRHYQMMYNVLSSDETDLIEWVDKKIKGEPCKPRCCNKLDSCCYENIDSCSVNECFKWEKVEW